ncbi:branched-chain amino acid ABC transporter permease [Bradyrhizobium diazoefficiens]
MSLAHDARVAVRPADLAERSARAWPEIDNPAAWIVAVLLLIMPLIANGFFLIEIFATTLILGIMALSLMFLAGYGGMVSLMQLTIAGFAAYMVAVFGVSANTNISLGWPWWLAVPVALALATVFGTLGGALAVRTEGIYTIMITLAIGAAFYYFTNQNWAIFNGHTGINTVATPHFWGVNWRADIPFYYIVLAVAALCYFAVDYISRAPFGLALQGVRDNPRRMAALGFNVNAHRVAAYAFASFVAALAGVLQVWNYRQISPGSVSVGACIDVLIIAVVGGITRPIGPFIGALIFVLLRTFALDVLIKFGLDGNRFRLLIGLGFLAIVFWSSDGVIGLWQRWRQSPRPTTGRSGRSARPWIASPSASPPSAPAPRSSCAA